MTIKQELINLKNKLFVEKQEKTNASGKVIVVRDELTEEMISSFRTFREGSVSPAAKAMADHFNGTRNISLDAKVDKFIDWYKKNKSKGIFAAIIEDLNDSNDMRNFIEKMAVWYELRYPDYEINQLLHGSEQEGIKINDVMFNSNKYINDLFDENADVRALDWHEFYNTKAFINSLPWAERGLLERARYRDLVYVDPHYRKAHLHLTSKGFVEQAEMFGNYTNFKVTDTELKGMHVKDVVKLLKEKGVSLPKNNELEETIKNVEKWNYQKDEMLNCVMYRIIERGGDRIGPRRGFLFAKEFGRNIDIPMMYAVELSDPNLRLFINEYIKAGGSKDLICYVNYFSEINKMKKPDTISIQNLILTQKNNEIDFYTPEERELHQRMVNAISSQIDHEEVKKEEVKQLRLQRRLAKSKRTDINNR